MPTNASPTYTYTVGSRTGAAPTSTSAQACCQPACCDLECLDRTRFFAGQLLTERDLNHEQAYLLAKNRLHNLYLHGWGVVCGLQVVCSECDGWVTVKSGYAIDPCGNDIIVCQDYAFNIAQAIQNCCAPPQNANCAPLRYYPSPSCTSATQTWCITIQYQEQQSRMVTPLMQMPNNGSSGSNGCSTNAASPPPCCPPPTSQTTSTTPIGACEATRILEGFQLGVMPAPPQPAQSPGRGDNSTFFPQCLEGATQPETFQYQYCQCYTTLLQLLAQNPYRGGIANANPQPSYQQAYQAVSNYLAAVQNALSSSFVTHCQIEEYLAAQAGRILPPGNPNATLAILDIALTDITQVIAYAVFDCQCTSLIPPCPVPPCDNRLILACVTVQNGQIQNICHFGGRRQVVTFPTLYYWLSLVGFDTFLDNLILHLQTSVCCGEPKERAAYFADTAAQSRDVVTGAGASNAAMGIRMVMDFIKQKLGATVVNAINPSSQTVDLRPYVGTTFSNTDGATFLKAQTSFQAVARSSTITQKDVTNDPAWTDEAVAASVRYTPSAFVPGQPLTVFTKGNLIVGFDVTNPADQIASLQATVANLQTTITGLQSTVTTLQNSAKPSQPPSPPGVPKTN